MKVRDKKELCLKVCYLLMVVLNQKEGRHVGTAECVADFRHVLEEVTVIIRGDVRYGEHHGTHMHGLVSIHAFWSSLKLVLHAQLHEAWFTCPAH
ncbi:hypothetical protein RRG08_039770 [Elysia crispata]|uniref:Uncharacterized protein n=1 Tax=Elysia crispata TaxID=231223 RepID=A0AAE0ZTM9_9GAST|nr:hypothetical protein RRG08_039770 [Elysia crispata]